MGVAPSELKHSLSFREALELDPRLLSDENFLRQFCASQKKRRAIFDLRPDSFARVIETDPKWTARSHPLVRNLMVDLAKLTSKAMYTVQGKITPQKEKQTRAALRAIYETLWSEVETIQQKRLQSSADPLNVKLCRDLPSLSTGVMLGIKTVVRTCLLLIRKCKIIDDGIVDEVLELVKDVLGDVPPLSLINSSTFSPDTANLLLPLFSFFEKLAMESSPETTNQAVEILLSFALARGSVAHLLGLIHVFLSNPLSTEYSITSKLNQYVTLQSSLVNQIKTSIIFEEKFLKDSNGKYFTANYENLSLVQVSDEETVWVEENTLHITNNEIYIEKLPSVPPAFDSVEISVKLSGVCKEFGSCALGVRVGNHRFSFQPGTDNFFFTDTDFENGQLEFTPESDEILLVRFLVNKTGNHHIIVTSMTSQVQTFTRMWTNRTLFAKCADVNSTSGFCFGIFAESRSQDSFGKFYEVKMTLHNVYSNSFLPLPHPASAHHPIFSEFITSFTNLPDAESVNGLQAALFVLYQMERSTTNFEQQNVNKDSAPQEILNRPLCIDVSQKTIQNITQLLSLLVKTETSIAELDSIQKSYIILSLLKILKVHMQQISLSRIDYLDLVSKEGHDNLKMHIFHLLTKSNFEEDVAGCIQAEAARVLSAGFQFFFPTFQNQITYLSELLDRHVDNDGISDSEKNLLELLLSRFKEFSVCSELIEDLSSTGLDNSSLEHVLDLLLTVCTRETIVAIETCEVLSIQSPLEVIKNIQTHLLLKLANLTQPENKNKQPIARLESLLGFFAAKLCKCSSKIINAIEVKLNDLVQYREEDGSLPEEYRQEVILLSQHLLRDSIFGKCCSPLLTALSALQRMLNQQSVELTQTLKQFIFDVDKFLVQLKMHNFDKFDQEIIKIHESSHPYVATGHVEERMISFEEGAENVVVEFDPRCATHESHKLQILIQSESAHRKEIGLPCSGPKRMSDNPEISTSPWAQRLNVDRQFYVRFITPKVEEPSDAASVWGYRLVIKASKKVEAFYWVKEIALTGISLTAVAASLQVMNIPMTKVEQTWKYHLEMGGDDVIFSCGVQKFSKWLDDKYISYGQFLPDDVVDFQEENKLLREIAFGSQNPEVEDMILELKKIPPTVPIPSSLHKSAMAVTRMCFAMLLKFTRCIDQFKTDSKTIKWLFKNARSLEPELARIHGQGESVADFVQHQKEKTELLLQLHVPCRSKSPTPKETLLKSAHSPKK